MGKRVIARRRGKGTATYRSPSFRHHGPINAPHSLGVAEVVSIDHDPGHYAPIAVLLMDNKEYRIPAFEGCYTGMKISCGESAPITRGTIKPIGKIPEGTVVSMVEVGPNLNKYYITSPGTSGLILSHGTKTVVLMPSGAHKEIHNDSLAMIGNIAGAGRRDKPIAKAGKKMLMFRSRAKAPITVRGVAMNPVNHPFGGGSHQHVGRPSTVSHSAWPGAKVGRLAPIRKKLKKKR